MQIRELYIDSFGFFTNQRIKGFQPGINVISGPNEFGKTTLLEFIRRILYGFPKKKAGVNPYPALGGGVYGGKLFCELANGEPIVISRTSGGRQGDVAVLINSRQIEGQKTLDAFLGYASEELYRNIFAFTLDELQVFGTLQGEEVKNRIYGAGLGLGARSITEVGKYFQERCDRLFVPRGKVREMSVLLNDMKTLQREIRELQNSLVQYDQLQDNVRRLEDKKKALEHNLQLVEIQKRALETQKDLYPVYVQMANAHEALGQLEETPDFPEHASETLAGLKSENKSLRDLLAEEREALEKLELERNSIFVNEALLRRQGEAASLRNIAEQARLAVLDIIKVRQQKELLDAQLQTEIKSVNPDWQESTAVDFEITEAEKEQPALHRGILEEARQKLSRAKDKLEMHRQQKAEERSKGLNVPEWLKVIAFSLLALGMGGLLWGGFASSPPLLILSAAVSVLGVVSVRMIYKKKDGLMKDDPFESLLVEKALQTEKEEDDRFAEWRVWLKQKNLDEYLSPLQVEKVLMIIQQIKGSLRQRAGLEDRLNHMRETTDKASRLIGELSPLLKIPAALDTDTGAMADIISHAYDEAAKNHEQKTNRQVQIEALENKIARRRKQLDGKNEDFLNFIRSVGAADEKDFDLKRSQLETKKSLKKTADENQGFIQSRVGFGKAYDNFLESLNQTPPEEIQHKLNRTTERLDQLHESRDRLNQAVGEIRSRINQLSAGDDLLAKQNELEIKKESLNRHAREWATCKIALFILEQAKQKYEQERQPDVIRAAEEIFSKVTGGKYRRIFKPFDNDEILIDNGAGQSKGVIEMSRGAREQLYLAMRLGLIEEYEARAEPLPVIMDDVLVNFDDQRRGRTMDILNNFAQSRQIIILTCHRQALASYKKLGAHQIEI